ncbi:ribonuclease Z [Prolixibacteraceae bacterium JC049]|nr:ribonuclease Z [Prolixibacteraceae bacterium JC049]
MNFDVTILGSNSALPTSNRFPTAQIVNLMQRYFLLDCGEGTQMQLRKYRIPFNRINHIMISHLHGDHYFGLIGLISTMNLLKRNGDLHIYAHSELPKLIAPQLEILKDELTFRIVWHPLSFKSPQKIYEDKTIEVHSFPVDHRVSCCGFLIKEKERFPHLRKEKIEFYNVPIKDRIRIKEEGADFITPEGKTIPNSYFIKPATPPRSYAFCTDTRYMEKIIPTIENCDLLYHEATFANDMQAMARQTYHATAREAAQIASKAKVGKLLIGHFSARYTNLNVLLNEAKEKFRNTELALEGNTFSIEIKK